MIGCEERRGHPLDRTVRGDRRSRGPACPPWPGQPKQLTDAELACLAVAQVLPGARSEGHWLRMCYGRLGDLFPYLPEQPGYHHKRLKATAPLLAAATDHLARQPLCWHDPVRLTGATPVPCGASCRRPGARPARRPGNEVAAELLAHAVRTGALRPGLILTSDKGFAGRDFEDLITTGYGLHLVRSDLGGLYDRITQRLLAMAVCI